MSTLTDSPETHEAPPLEFESGPQTRRFQALDRLRPHLERLWSHPWSKPVALGLAVILAVVVIVSGIRLLSGSSGSSQLTPTTSAQSAAGPAHHGPAPISAAEMTLFNGYADGLKKANAAATTGFVSAGSTPTPSKVAATISSYRSALNLYYFQLHFIHWPASMQTATEVEYAQLQALMSFMQSFSTVSPAGISAWLSQLHNRTGTTEAADNQVRHDLGLPATSTFP